MSYQSIKEENTMNINEAISSIGVVPVIKLNHP